jgi:hypothetical protein
MVILESVVGWSEQGDSSPGIPADSAYTTMQPFPWHAPELETIRIRAFPSVNPVNEVIPATTDSHLTAIRELFEQWLSPRLLNSTATPRPCAAANCAPAARCEVKERLQISFT